MEQRPPGIEFHTFTIPYDNLRQVDARVPPLDDWLQQNAKGEIHA